MSGTGAAAGSTARIGRNDACPCGSGRKYKHCCQGKASGGWRPRARFRRDRRRAKPSALRFGVGGKPATRTRARWPEAVAAFEELARHEPNSAEALFNLGGAYLRWGGRRGGDDPAAGGRTAAELCGSADELDPGAWADGRRPEALSAYCELSRMPNDPLQRRHFLAQALEIEGKAEEAESELRRVLAASPGQIDLSALLGQLLLRRGAFEEGQRHLGRPSTSCRPVFRHSSRQGA